MLFSDFCFLSTLFLFVWLFDLLFACCLFALHGSQYLQSARLTQLPSPNECVQLMCVRSCCLSLMYVRSCRVPLLVVRHTRDVVVSVRAVCSSVAVRARDPP